MSDPKRVHNPVENSRLPVQPRIHRLAKHNFFRAAALGLAVLTGGTALMLPKDARAQTVQVEGVKVQTGRLSDTLDNLLKKKPKQNGGIASNGNYSASVMFPQELFAVFAMAPSPNGGWGTSGITISFPRPDQPPNASWATWGRSVPGFVPLVKKLTGKDVNGLVIVTERTVEEGVPLIYAYGVPIDDRGNVIGKYKGGQLALGVSFSPQDGSAGGGVILMLDPGVPEPNLEAAAKGNKVALK